MTEHQKKLVELADATWTFLRLVGEVRELEPTESLGTLGNVVLKESFTGDLQTALYRFLDDYDEYWGVPKDSL